MICFGTTLGSAPHGMIPGTILGTMARIIGMVTVGTPGIHPIGTVAGATTAGGTTAGGGIPTAIGAGPTDGTITTGTIAGAGLLQDGATEA